MLTFCLLWGWLVPSSAQIYKWVDDKGTTHYGERAPQGRKAQEIGPHLANPGAAPEKAVQPDWNEKELEFRKRRIEAAQAEAQRAQQAASAQKACTLARDRLAQMKSARRIYRLDENGARVYQTDNERRTSVEHLEAQVAERCLPP